jgi:rhodanese-related sulfurtransferase
MRLPVVRKAVPGREPTTARASITPDELLEQIQAGRPPTILDVRSRLEYSGGHIPGAVHASFWSSPRSAVEQGVSPEGPLVIYCGHGPRARMSAAIFRRHGFSNVKLLEGHMSVWRAQGFPLERHLEGVKHER